MKKQHTIMLALLYLLFSATANAQEMPEIPQPTDEHKWLEQFVGEWETVGKTEAGPGAPEMTCTGKITSRMLGGYWVVNEMKGETAGMAMQGLQTIGYDPEKKKYVGTWVDSMMGHMWQYTGSVDKTGKILSLEAKGPSFMTDGKETLFRDVYEFKSKDEIVATSQMQGPDGEWITFMTGTSKRVKK